MPGRIISNAGFGHTYRDVAFFRGARLRTGEATEGENFELFLTEECANKEKAEHYGNLRRRGRYWWVSALFHVSQQIQNDCRRIDHKLCT